MTNMPVMPTPQSMIDIAANLTHDSFDIDFETVLEAARTAGVEKFLVVGTDKEASEKANQLAEHRPELFRATAGLHPHHASDWDDDHRLRFTDWLQLPNCVAAGEMGLDYFRNFSPHEDQRKAFAAQLKLAIDHKLPAYLHVREAAEDFIPMLREHRSDLVNAIVHCFTGTQAELEAYLELGCGIGITGWVCDERRGLELQQLVPLIPDDRLMIETDCPYLLPRTIKPKPKTRRNEPKYLTAVRDTVAELRGVSIEVLAQQTWENTHRYFDFVER